MVDNMFPVLKYVKNYMLNNHWPSNQRIKNIKVPILFLISKTKFIYIKVKMMK